MSLIGKNIKKIRSIKGLSQQAFAEIFGLKRATLGAYEEERSEPRIETIIKIANYFSLSIDSLLVKELTVNQLLKFKSEITAQADEMIREKYPMIPCITSENCKDYIKYHDKPNFIKDMSYLRLPLDKSGAYRAYTVLDLEMSQQDSGFYPKDVVVGEGVAVSDVYEIKNATPVLVLTDERLIFRRLFVSGRKIILRADHGGIEDILLSIKEIKEIWAISSVYFQRVPAQQTDDLELRLQKIEKMLGKHS